MKFEKNNYYYVALVWVSTIISGVINYFYHPIMLRFLDSHIFWEFESIVSIFNILWVLTAWIWLFLVEQITRNSEDKKFIASILYSWTNFLFFLWLAISLIFAIFSPFIANFLHIENIVVFWLVASTILPAFMGVVIWSIVSWKKMFEFIAFSNIFSSIVRFLCWVILVKMWYGLMGAVIWYVVSSYIVYLVQYFYIKSKIWNNIFSKKNIWYWQIKTIFYQNFKNLFWYFLITFIVIMFSNIDILIVKNLYSPQQAWNYAALSVLAKFLLFLGWAIESVYYPQIMKFNSKDIPQYLIKNSLWIVGFIIFCWIIGGYFLWFFVLKILKPWLESYSNMLVPLIIWNGGLIIITMLWKILVGWKNYFINYVLLFALIFLIGIIYFIHPSLQNLPIVFALYFSSLAIMLTLLVYFRPKWLN